MQANSVLNFTTPSRSIKLTKVFSASIRTSSIRFVGASFPVPAMPGQLVDALSIQAPEVGVGLLVLAVSYSHFLGAKQGWKHDTVVLMLRVEQIGSGITFVSTDRGGEWTPLLTRDGVLRNATTVSHGDKGATLLVQVGEMFYSSSLLDKDRPGFRYVPDVNLLCRYLSAQAEVADLEAAAVAAAEEQDIREAIAVLQLKSASQESEISRLQTQQENDGRKILDLNKQLNEALERMRTWRDIAAAFHWGLSLPWWFQRKQPLAEANGNYNQHHEAEIKADIRWK